MQMRYEVFFACGKLFRKFIDNILNLIYPTKCVICKEISKSIICPDCEPKLSDLKEPAFFRRNINGNECLYVYNYENEAVKNLILYMKENDNTALFDNMAKRLYEALLCEICFSFSPLIITNIPRRLSAKRKNGFDQAENIAKAIAKLSKGKIKYKRILRRRFFTKEQKKLDAESRAKNMENAFYVHDTGFENIILIDDVVTTGSTLLSAVKAFKFAGVKNVILICVASAKGEGSTEKN